MRVQGLATSVKIANFDSNVNHVPSCEYKLNALLLLKIYNMHTGAIQSRHWPGANVVVRCVWGKGGYRVETINNAERMNAVLWSIINQGANLGRFERSCQASFDYFWYSCYPVLLLLILSMPRASHIQQAGHSFHYLALLAQGD